MRYNRLGINIDTNEDGKTTIETSTDLYTLPVKNPINMYGLTQYIESYQELFNITPLSEEEDKQLRSFFENDYDDKNIYKMFK